MSKAKPHSKSHSSSRAKAVPSGGQGTSPQPSSSSQTTPAPKRDSSDAALPIEVRLPPTRTNTTKSSTSSAKGGVLPREVVQGAQQRVGASARAKGSSRRPEPKARPLLWLGAGLGVLLLVTGGAAAGAYSRFAGSDLIAPGVSIAGVPVAGLSQAQAKQAVAARFADTSLSLRAGEHAFQVPASQLGARLCVEETVAKAFAVGRDGSIPSNWLRACAPGEERRLGLPIQWDKTRLVRSLYQLADKVEEKPANARLVGSDLGLTVVPDRAGRQLNVGQAAHLLQARYFIGLASLELPLRPLAAKISARDLQGRDVELGRYTTRFNPGLEGRTENIRLACRAIENHVLMPGEVFSFNACTGERTARKGYRMAHIFIREPGEDEPEVADGLAGGVCQVSSTLFNAVRKTRAGEAKPLRVVERNTHSLPVTYVPSGLDATVAWPGKDFKFRNQAQFPVYLRTEMGRSKLSISIWGRVPV